MKLRRSLFAALCGIAILAGCAVAGHGGSPLPNSAAGRREHSSASASIWVANAGGSSVKKIKLGCTNGGSCSITKTGAGFNSPDGVAVDATGNVYVADTGNNLVKEIPKTPA